MEEQEISPRIEIFSKKSEYKAMAIIYGGAFTFTVCIILPWIIGVGMLSKWILF